MNNIIEEIKSKLEDLENQKQQLLKGIQKDFPAIFKPLFDKSKKIESIGFTGYTPYFNDGDECVYSVNTDDLYINGEYCDDVEWYSWKIKYDKYREELKNEPDVDIEESKIVEEFSEVLGSIPDEFYKSLFGDHCRVTIYRDGTTETEEYDHD